MKTYKKILAGLMAVSIAAPLTVSSTSAVTPPRPRGDINYDGVFNLSDTVMFSRWLHGTGTINDTEMADMNKDGNIDVFDFVAMRKSLLGMISSAEQKYRSSGSISLCAGLEDSNPDGTKIDDTFRNGQAQFTLDIFKREFKEDENSLVSPYSIIQAMAMTANGAGGETKDEMEKALGGLPVEDLDKYLATWRRNQPDSEECKLLTANSVWIRDNEELIKPQPQFIQDVVDYFNAEVFKAPFDNSTVNDINSWVSDHTDQMIPTIIEELPNNCMMTLVNAVTFEAKWQDQYEEYQIRPYDFTAYNGEVKNVDMLCDMETIYLEDENSKGFVKYYEDPRYAFVAVLPDEDVNIKDYVESLTVEKMSNLYKNQSHSYDVDTRMPKFKYDCKMILNDTLIDMGMETAFNPDRADFTNMVTPDSLPLYISKVIHKTYIELDENGTKAAAATAVMMSGGCAMTPPEIKEVYLDRPFVYAIVDTNAGLPVFMGAVMELGE